MIMSLTTKKVMPWFALLIALAFTGIDTFTNYEISDHEMTSVYALLAPFGLASVIKSGYDIHKKSKSDVSNMTEDEKAQLDKLLKKAGLK